MSNASWLHQIIKNMLMGWQDFNSSLHRFNCNAFRRYQRIVYRYILKRSRCRIFLNNNSEISMCKLMESYTLLRNSGADYQRQDKTQLLKKLHCFNAVNAWIIYPIAYFSFKLFFKTSYLTVTGLFPVMVEKKKKFPLRN